MGKRDRKYYRRKIRHIFLITLLMCFFIGIGISVYWVSQAIHSAEGKSGFLPSYVASKEDAASALYPDENGKIVAAYAPSSSALEPLASEVSSQPEPTAPDVPPSQAEEPVVPEEPSSQEPEDPAPEYTPPPIDPNGPPYQSKYPELYAKKNPSLQEPPKEKAVYLTFDDGPSHQTLKILDILDTYEVKATFFVIGKSDEESKRIMKEIVDRGHAIGVHTYSHDYRKIYASTEAFLDDFAKMHQLIYDATGVNTSIYRYAGGSVNGFNKKTVLDTVKEMNRRGFVYFDWNVSAGDAERGATKASIYNDTVKGVRSHGKSIILCHDAAAKSDTVSQLPSILWQLKKEGYHFETLNESVEPIIFPLPKQ